MSIKKYLRSPKDLMSMPVVRFPDGKNYLAWRELFHGVFCAGNAGSGKTSGPLTWFLKDVLVNETRPGGLILCVKKDDRLRWEKLIREAGRGEDLIIIGPDNPNVSVNPLEYELYRNGRKNVNYTSALDLLMELLTLAETFQAAGGSGGENDRFWDKELRKIIVRTMMLLDLAEEPVTIENMRKVLINAFKEDDIETYSNLWARIEQEDNPDRAEAIQEYNDWRATNYWLSCFEKANEREDLTEDQLAIMQLVGEYYFKVWPRVSDRTRAIVEASALGLYEPFMTGVLRSFCSKMSDEIRPERTYEEGKIYLVDVPIKENGVSAVYANGTFKRLFQLCIERRIPDQEENPRPVFLFCDEYHLTCSPQNDDRFQSACRSVLCASFYATQSINNLKISMGKDLGESKTKALLANLGSMAFCGNVCRDSNIFASELIGKKFINMNSSSFNTDDKGSHSTSEQLHPIVPPEHFTTLKSGGAENNYQVETIIVCRGKQWSTGEPFLEQSFDQRGRRKNIFQRLLAFFI